MKFAYIFVIVFTIFHNINLVKVNGVRSSLRTEDHQQRLRRNIRQLLNNSNKNVLLENAAAAQAPENSIENPNGMRGKSNFDKKKTRRQLEARYYENPLFRSVAQRAVVPNDRKYFENDNSADIAQSSALQHKSLEEWKDILNYLAGDHNDQGQRILKQRFYNPFNWNSKRNGKYKSRKPCPTTTSKPIEPEEFLAIEPLEECTNEVSDNSTESNDLQSVPNLQNEEESMDDEATTTPKTFNCRHDIEEDENASNVLQDILAKIYRNMPAEEKQTQEMDSDGYWLDELDATDNENQASKARQMETIRNNLNNANLLQILAREADLDNEDYDDEDKSEYYKFEDDLLTPACNEKWCPNKQRSQYNQQTLQNNKTGAIVRTRNQRSYHPKLNRLEATSILEKKYMKFDVGSPSSACLKPKSYANKKEVAFKSFNYPNYLREIPLTKSINSTKEAPDYNDQLDIQQNNLSHEANYKLSKQEQEVSEKKPQLQKSPKYKLQKNGNWKWKNSQRNTRRSADLQNLNTLNEIKLKTSKRLMKKGLGSSLSSHNIKKNRRELCIDNAIKRGEQEIVNEQIRARGKKQFLDFSNEDNYLEDQSNWLEENNEEGDLLPLLYSSSDVMAQRRNVGNKRNKRELSNQIEMPALSNNSLKYTELITDNATKEEGQELAQINRRERRRENQLIDFNTENNSFKDTKWLKERNEIDMELGSKTVDNIIFKRKLVNKLGHTFPSFKSKLIPRKKHLPKHENVLSRKRRSLYHQNAKYNPNTKEYRKRFYDSYRYDDANDPALDYSKPEDDNRLHFKRFAKLSDTKYLESPLDGDIDLPWLQNKLGTSEDQNKHLWKKSANLKQKFERNMEKTNSSADETIKASNSTADNGDYQKVDSEHNSAVNHEQYPIVDHEFHQNVDNENHQKLDYEQYPTSNQKYRPTDYHEHHQSVNYENHRNIDHKQYQTVKHEDHPAYNNEYHQTFDHKNHQTVDHEQYPNVNNENHPTDNNENYSTVDRPTYDYKHFPIADREQYPTVNHENRPIYNNEHHQMVDHENRNNADNVVNQDGSPMDNYEHHPMIDHKNHQKVNHEQYSMVNHDDRPQENHEIYPTVNHEHHPTVDYKHYPIVDHEQYPNVNHEDRPIDNNGYRPMVDYKDHSMLDHEYHPTIDHEQHNEECKPLEVSINPILNCSAYSDLKEFLETLPKNLTAGILTPDQNKTQCFEQEDGNINIDFTTVETGIDEFLMPSTENYEEESFSSSSTEHPEQQAQPEVEVTLPTNGIDESESTQLPMRNITDLLNNDDDLKLNVNINAKLFGNSKSKHFYGNGTVNVLPGFDDDRLRREVYFSPFDEWDMKQTSQPDCPETESLNEIASGKFSSQLVNTILEEVQRNPKLRSLWPSLKDNQIKRKSQPKYFYSLKNNANQKKTQESEKLFQNAMNSINGLIDERIRSEACVPLPEELEEFLQLVLESQAKRENKRQNNQSDENDNEQEFNDF